MKKIAYYLRRLANYIDPTQTIVFDKPPALNSNITVMVNRTLYEENKDYTIKN